METQEYIGKGISYDHLRADDKHYFGGFLNLAQNNINSVIKEFCLRLNLEYSTNHNQVIDKYFKENISYTDRERAIKILNEYWPVVELINLPITHSKFENLPDLEKENAQHKYFSTTLKSLLTAINDLRNFYTHYYHPPVDLPDELFLFLDEAMFKTIVGVKKTKMKNDKTRQLLKKTLKGQLEQLEQLKKKQLIEKKRNNQKINLHDSDGIFNAVYNDAFSHLLYKDTKNKQEQLSKYYESRLEGEQVTNISMAGLLFLLSFFLSRKEAEQCRSNITGYKGTIFASDKLVTPQENGLKYMATHWVFSVLTFKGLKHRITSAFSKETFMMQIVEELSKVPEQVYQVLSEDNQKTFLEDNNEYVSESSNDGETPSYVVHPVIRKRYEDKFRYFAIRFLDEYANFPSLRFQIFAGQYVHDSRPKKIAGTTTVSERTIKERMNVFGRLSEVVKLKNDYFKRNIEPSGWELFPNPSYHWVENNIPVYINLISKGGKAKDIQIHRLQLHKKLKPRDHNEERKNRISKEKITNEVFGKQVAWGIPTCMLSQNELMSILFEFLVNKKSGEELENHIVDKIIERYELLHCYSPEESQNISKAILPARLLKSKANMDFSDYTKLISAITKQIEEGEKKQRLLEKHKQEFLAGDSNRKRKPGEPKPRKYLFYASEMGEEATWIVNDIKRFMPEEARKNWKGYHHSELQRLIAYYPTHRKEAYELLASVWNMNASSPYWTKSFPDLFKNEEFESFYRGYLIERKKLLDGFVLSINNNKHEPKILKKALKDIYIVFDERLYQIPQTQKQKDELLAKPFVFPRGIFDQKPTVIPGSSPRKEPSKFADWYIYGYNYDGKYQQFYSLPREYKHWYERLSATKKIEKFCIDCDQQIKKMQFQDVYLKLIVDKLFMDVFNQQISVDLSAFYDTPEKRSSYAEKALLQTKRKVGDCSENVLNEIFFWSKTTSVELYEGRIVEPQVKMKDLGKFRRFLSDEKVVTLLSYDEEKVWNKQQIEAELENKSNSYEHIRRHHLLRKIHQFEKDLLEHAQFNGTNHPERFLSGKGYPSFKMYVLHGALDMMQGISCFDYKLLIEKDFESFQADDVRQLKPIVQKAFLLIYLRNKFGHNQLPQKAYLELMRKLYPDIVLQNSFSEYFNQIVCSLVSDFKIE